MACKGDIILFPHIPYCTILGTVLGLIGIIIIGVCLRLLRGRVGNWNIIELHTGLYSNGINKSEELNKIKFAAKYAYEKNIEVHAGHGLNFDNVKNIAKIKYISELNIGHFLIGESIFMSLEKAIMKMKKIIDIELWLLV